MLVPCQSHPLLIMTTTEIYKMIKMYCASVAIFYQKCFCSLRKNISYSTLELFYLTFHFRFLNNIYIR